ncbi:hypothetical protein [Mucilaginibacter sp.]|uniref:hypothetical protein n=1 Tax=Mucilaginibacter sp. TaxID=1882438 RepID=UPI00283B7847|nr:hypothetical protein [Mucilaginibacter sp.]MDR3694436.1 hypothetical protein [Mucilaginibacter sp.]
MIHRIAHLSFFILLFLSRAALAQEIIDTPIVHDLTPKVYKTFTVKGRVLGMNLEFVQGVTVTNKRTSENVTTDVNGIFRITATTGDTLFFNISKYSNDTLKFRSPKENLNLVMIKRKVDSLPPGCSAGEYNRAKREDNELYRILEKDAKLEGKWKY